MSEIRKDDLVMVVRSAACCGGSRAIGRIFRAIEVVPIAQFKCKVCGHRDVIMGLATTGFVYPSGIKEALPLSRLKRIEPPALETDTHEERHVTA